MNSKAHFKDFNFNLEETFGKQLVDDFKKSYEPILQHRKLRWQSTMRNGLIPRYDSQMKRFVRKGIPDEFRAKVWFMYSGAEKYYSKQRGKYQKWKIETISRPNLEVINADIPRTFPENEQFRDVDHPQSLLPQLRSILTAFVAKNPNVGYCQGMNFVAGIILLVMMPDEEKAFWVFNTLVTDILQSYYLPGMLRVQVDCMVLDELLKSKLPRVGESILIKCQVKSIIICAKWFICAFVDVLPVQTVLRVLDCVLCEGDKILFRTALAIIKLNSEAIEKCNDVAQLMMLFKDIMHSKSILDCNALCQCMFSTMNPLPQSWVNRLRVNAEANLKANKK